MFYTYLIRHLSQPINVRLQKVISRTEKHKPQSPKETAFPNNQFTGTEMSINDPAAAAFAAEASASAGEVQIDLAKLNALSPEVISKQATVG